MAVVFPSGNRPGEDGRVRNPPVHTWRNQDTEVGLGPMPPTAMLRGGLYLQTLHQPPCLGWGQGLIQGRWRVRREILHDQHHVRGLGLRLIDDLADQLGNVEGWATLRHLDPPLPSPRREPHAQVRRALPLVRVIYALGLSWGSRKRRTGFRHQWCAGLV